MNDPTPDPTTDWTPAEPAPTWLDADRRPDGVSDETVDALGTLSEACEWLERARGHLYAFHQMSGRVDLLLGEAVDGLREAGHDALADSAEAHLIGRNVLDGRWSFQIVEEYDATYWAALRDFHAHAKNVLVAGADHVFESEMKDDRRTAGSEHHERRPEP
ncbi:MAG: hypothetical protein OSA99_15700 [Acidimicrobiales bacterium]|nr:hypothetical protein [Acidimicrobiales bacterium]